MRMRGFFLGLLFLVAGAVPAFGQAAPLQWLCRPATATNSAGYCQVSAANPLPTSGGGSTGSDVNITGVGGNAVTTTLPISGTVTATSSPATGVAITTSASVGVASAQALASGARKYLLLNNESASAFVACAFAGSAALNTAGSITLAPYQSFTWESSFVPNDAVNCIASAAATPLTIVSQ